MIMMGFVLMTNAAVRADLKQRHSTLFPFTVALLRRHWLTPDIIVISLLLGFLS